MKTITPKNVLKLFLFLLILFSAKVFSLPRLPSEASSIGCESKFGSVSKVKKNTTTSSAYVSTYKDNATQSKNNKRFKK